MTSPDRFPNSQLYSGASQLSVRVGRFGEDEIGFVKSATPKMGCDYFSKLWIEW